MFFFSISLLFSQDSINTKKGNWFFGAEMGRNKIQTFQNGEKSSYIQGGLTAEYYFSDDVSFTAKVKYFQTGASYKSGIHYIYFFSENIVVPVNMKIEVDLWRGLKGYFRFGLAYNKEIKSSYHENTSADSSMHHSSSFLNFNPGIGFTYFFSPTLGIYIENESFSFGGATIPSDSFLIPSFQSNGLINIGVKYNPF